MGGGGVRLGALEEAWPALRGLIASFTARFDAPEALDADIHDLAVSRVGEVRKLTENPITCEAPSHLSSSISPAPMSGA